MGYALYSARKILLTNRINTLSFQQMCLSEMKTTMSNVLGNYQRQLSQYQSYGTIMQQLAQYIGLSNGNYNYTALASGMLNSFLPLFQQYALTSMIESDIDAQLKQIETQLKAAEKELESVEKAEDKAIERSTPKYA